MIFRPKHVKWQLELHLSAAKPEAVNCCWSQRQLTAARLTTVGSKFVTSMCYYELFDFKTTNFYFLSNSMAYYVFQKSLWSKPIVFLMLVPPPCIMLVSTQKYMPLWYMLLDSLFFFCLIHTTKSKHFHVTINTIVIPWSF